MISVLCVHLLPYFAVMEGVTVLLWYEANLYSAQGEFVSVCLVISNICAYSCHL